MSRYKKSAKRPWIDHHREIRRINYLRHEIDIERQEDKDKKKELSRLIRENEKERKIIERWIEHDMEQLRDRNHPISRQYHERVDKKLKDLDEMVAKSIEIRNDLLDDNIENLEKV